jgi:hypothetical protein
MLYQLSRFVIKGTVADASPNQIQEASRNGGFFIPTPAGLIRFARFWGPMLGPSLWGAPLQ